MGRLIQLTQNQITLVSEEDFEWLSEFKWHALFKLTYSGDGGFVAIRSKPRTTILMHRVIMEYVLNRQLDRLEWVDHIDGDPLNNCRENLRVVTVSQSGINRRIHANNKSGFKGVHWYKAMNKWRAQISIDGKQIHLGQFDTAELASEAYQNAAKELHGDYRRK